MRALYHCAKVHLSLYDLKFEYILINNERAAAPWFTPKLLRAKFRTCVLIVRRSGLGLNYKCIHRERIKIALFVCTAPSHSCAVTSKSAAFSAAGRESRKGLDTQWQQIQFCEKNGRDKTLMCSLRSDVVSAGVFNEMHDDWNLVMNYDSS
jgi:hypothetical protein